MSPWAPALVLALCALPVPARPPAPSPHLDPAVDAAAAAEAVRIGTTRDATVLDRFHGPYRIPLGGPLLQSLEVVSEFRRLVLLTEEHVRRADVTWNARSALEAAETHRGLFSLVLRVRFDPRNVYRTVPAFQLALYGPGGEVTAPIDVQATPTYLSGPAPPGTPILEATIEAFFRMASVDPRGRCLVGVFLEGRELERVPIDLGTMR